jgi:hypothetical protein
VSLGEVLPSIEGEHEHLIPLLSSIGGQQRAREETLRKLERWDARWLSTPDEWGIYSP